MLNRRTIPVIPVIAVAMLSCLYISTVADTIDPVYYQGTTRKLSQVTGDYDRALRMPTASRTESRYGLVSTDLGSSFEHGGRLVLLFGDSFGRERDMDCLAYSDSTNPFNFEIQLPLGADGAFRDIRPPGIGWGAFCVPSFGISLNGTMYVVYTTDWISNPGRPELENMGRSVLIKSVDDGASWEVVADVSRHEDGSMANAHFINVCLKSPPPSIRGRHDFLKNEDMVLIWGSGAYRKSSPRFAASTIAAFETPAAWKYFTGLDAAGNPQWSASQADAVPIFDDPIIGEFSVSWVEPLGRWVCLYNGVGIILMRTAREPWGPFSDAQLVLHPWWDEAQGRYIHNEWTQGRIDGFHDPGRENDFGGVYGPYVIDRFTRGTRESCDIYYTMSTWNPYQTVLMRTTLGYTPPETGHPTSISRWRFDDPEWIYTEPRFADFPILDGSPHLLTHTAGRRDSATGYAWRWLPNDGRDIRLKFSVHGGAGEVVLLEGGGEIPPGLDADEFHRRLKQNEFGRVVQCATGLNSNDDKVPVDWYLPRFNEGPLKVVIVDPLTTPWGFVCVSGMELTRRSE